MDNLTKQFGLIVAYLIPGFIGLVGLAPLVPAIGQWLQPVAQGDLGFGPPIYALLGATAVGMIVSCFRWLVIDHLHHWTGISPVRWNDEVLAERLEAFNYLVDSHYRYYQFYANGIMAVLLTYGLNRVAKTSPLWGIGTDLGVMVLCVVLFAGSRDALAKYYQRTGRLVGELAEEGSWGDVMTNGNHHGQEAGAGNPQHAEVKPGGKAAPAKPQQPETKGSKAAK